MLFDMCNGASPAALYKKSKQIVNADVENEVDRLSREFLNKHFYYENMLSF
jgi:hypothetical protein